MSLTLTFGGGACVDVIVLSSINVSPSPALFYMGFSSVFAISPGPAVLYLV